MTVDDRMLSKTEVARFFGCTPRSVDNWVKRGSLPKPNRAPNGRPMWPASVIQNAVAEPAAA